eukprot:278071-Prorocentrum_minimum.AAC.1
MDGIDDLEDGPTTTAHTRGHNPDMMTMSGDSHRELVSMEARYENGRPTLWCRFSSVRKQ